MAVGWPSKAVLILSRTRVGAAALDVCLVSNAAPDGLGRPSYGPSYDGRPTEGRLTAGRPTEGRLTGHPALRCNTANREVPRVVRIGVAQVAAEQD